jgi:acetyl-CoA carboxylase biotin carboxylase subunit
MFSSVLVANRGEIAVRVIRTCREMGIRTVAVFSDADATAPHVGLADRAVRLGPGPAAQSYLRGDAIIEAAQRTGAEAIHPGYGFLSENAAFARACGAAGVVFVGPPPEAIDAMGSKVRARELMHAAGVPVVPGQTPSDQSDDALLAAIEQVGLPALIKPSSGGGGIGMREVRDLHRAVDAVQAARRDAEGAFGNGTLYVERLIERPRHIEVQIFADDHGSVVSLFERECSLQRRHQKVIEESPSPALTPAMRAEMGAAAVAAARAAGYRNAGTVEFLVEGADGEHPRFYFLEMNTRLQVEHPVTEQITGLDLVRAQLCVAAGLPLPFDVERLTTRGHAIELRIYAEDPASGFLPRAGRLLLYREPGGPGVRVDSGVTEGSEVSVHYDPLLAKLIVTAETRATALARAERALAEFPVLGIVTNLPFLLALLRHPDVRAGRLDTHWIERHLPELTATPEELPEDIAATVAIAAAQTRGSTAGATGSAEPPDPWVTIEGWRG